MFTRCTTRYMVYKPHIGDVVILSYWGYKRRINLLNNNGKVIGRVNTKKRMILFSNNRYLKQLNFLPF